MKDIKELYQWLEENKSEEDLLKHIEANCKELIKTYGTGSDLYYKTQIRRLDNLKNLTEYHFREKFPNLIRKEDWASR